MDLQAEVIPLLKTMGVKGAKANPLLGFVIGAVTERIRNETNQPEIPEGLRYVAVGMVLGQYLSLKKGMGLLDIENLDLEAGIKQIQEGDTNTVFATGEGSLTPEQRLDNLTNYLMNGRTNEFLRYRRIVW